MDDQALVLELKQILEKLGIELREQALQSELGKAKSGLVRIRDKKIFFLEGALSQKEKIKLLIELLKGWDLEAIYISPYLRERIRESK